jgi:3-hexulose-6-phosphate synthase
MANSGGDMQPALRRDRALLQLAIDATSTKAALALADAAYPHFDIAETGTPLIIEEGLSALEALKARFPGKLHLADLKIMDAGRLEASSALRRGADLVTVLALADDRTMAGALESAAEYGGMVMADLVNCADPVPRAVQLEAMGVQCVCLHLAYDVQGGGDDPLRHLRELRAAVACGVAVAGGIGLTTIGPAIESGADVIVVGGAVRDAVSPGEAARLLMAEVRGGSADG